MSVYVEMETAQFENVNSLRRHPFADYASLVDSEGKELPLEAIVDARLVVPAEYDNPSADPYSPDELPSARLSSFHVSRSMVSACFVSDFRGKRSALSVTVSAKSFRPYFPYRLDKLIGSSDIGGIVAFGDILSAYDAEDGLSVPKTYFLDSAYLHPCQVAVATPARLRRIIDGRTGKSLSGHVDIEFSGYVNASRDGKSVSLSLDPNAVRELASECDNATGTEICGTTPITSINGVRPNSNGEIVLWFH